MPTATLTITPTATPVLPTPLPDAFLTDYVFGAVTSDCVLPCWHGLRVGSSTRSDVYEVLDADFGFGGYRPTALEAVIDRLPPQLDAVGQGWAINDVEGIGSVGIAIYLDREHDTLEAIASGWLGLNQSSPYPTVQRVMRELGEPAYIFTDISIGGHGNAPEARISLEIFYEAGMVFDFTQGFPVTELRQSNGQLLAVATNLCLDERPANSSGGFVITSPFKNGLDDLSPIQEFFFDDLLARSVPLEEITTLTLSEITRLAQVRNNACIRLNLEQFNS